MFSDLNDLCNALDREELVPCFQPIVELPTGKIAGFEVLARWQHPRHNLILPENFIALAEENGLASRLMSQILSRAFALAPLLPSPLILAVNVSPGQLQDLALPGRIRALANEAGFPLRRLQVEITETALVENIELAKMITQVLKAMGCKLVLDDFGAGFSNLRHLQELPFDVLKVDRSFVESMTDERDARKIAAAIFGLGRSLGLVTVAKGIETREQAEMLRLLGCEMGQGWIYGKPLPAESIPRILAGSLPEFSSKSTLRRTDDTACLEALPTHHAAQLKAIYDGAPVGMGFLDMDLRYVSLNRRLAEMNGAAVAEHIGRTIQEMLPWLSPTIEPYLLLALRGQPTTDMELSRPSPKRGEPDMTTLVSYQPAFDEAVEVIGVSITVLDITDWKRVKRRWQARPAPALAFVSSNPALPNLPVGGSCR